MDEALVTRWRQGDPNARPGVRNGLRAIADRVLSHPGILDALPPQELAGFAREDRRREKVTDIAREVMERGAQSVTQLTAMTLVVSGRKVVEALQRDRADSGEAHLPPQVTATLAVAGDALSAIMREAAQRHLDGCAACARDIDLLHRAMRADGGALAEAEDLQIPELQPGQELAEAAPEDAPDPGRLLRPDGQGAKAPAAAPPVVAPPAARRAVAPAARAATSSRRPRFSRTPEVRQSPLRLAMPVVVVFLGLFAAWWWGLRPPHTPATIQRLSALADRSSPRIQLGREDLPEDVALAQMELNRGDCRSAAARLLGARREAPEDGALALWEAQAWVCAGEGEKAQRVLELATKRGLALPRGEAWVRANAALLNGDAPTALVALGHVVEADPRNRDAARLLSERVRAAR